MIEDIHRRLGIPADYGQDPYIAPQSEAIELVDIGPDIYGRPQRSTPDAAAGWGNLCAAAEACGIELLLVSAFRSVAYQTRLFEERLSRGQTIEAICDRARPRASASITPETPWT